MLKIVHENGLPTAYFVDGKPCTHAHYYEVFDAGDAEAFTTETHRDRLGGDCFYHRCVVRQRLAFRTPALADNFARAMDGAA